MTNTAKQIIALMEDLMFMVRIQEAAKRAGLSTVVVKTKADLLRKAAEQPVLVIIDLNYNAGQPLEAIEQKLERDSYMSAQEAKDFGIVDDVVKNQPVFAEGKSETVSDIKSDSKD